MDEYTVVGVDPSARKLAAMVSRGDDWETVVDKMPADMNARCLFAYRWMRDIVRASPKPVAVFIEQPFAGKFRGPGMVLAKIHGAMLAGALVAGADIVMPAENLTWKSKVIGRIPRGSDHKRAIRRYLRVHWFEAWDHARGDQDLMDASLINRYGVSILRMRKLISTGGVDAVRGRSRVRPRKALPAKGRR